MEFDIDILELIEKDRIDSKKLSLPYDINITGAQGSKLYGEEGKEYLDLTSNFDNNFLGYNNDVLKQAITDNCNYPVFLSANLKNDLAKQLSEKINKLAGLPNIFLSNSALEANETVIKLIKAFIKYNNIPAEKSELLIFSGTFENPKLNLYKFVDIEAEEKMFSTTNLKLISSSVVSHSSLRNLFSKRIAGVIIDPLDSLNGSFYIDNDILSETSSLCERYGTILALNLTETALGRSGKVFDFGIIKPDIISASKSLAYGLGLGITAVSDRIFSDLKKYEHQYGASTLACRLAIKYFETIEDENFINTVNQLSEYLLNSLTKIEDKYLNLIDIDIKGLLCTVEFDFNLVELIENCVKDGVIFEMVTTKTLRLRPPACIERSEIDYLISILDKHLDKLQHGSRLI